MTRVEIVASTDPFEFNNIWLNFRAYIRSQNAYFTPATMKDTLLVEFRGVLHRHPYYLTFENDHDSTIFLLRFS